LIYRCLILSLLFPSRWSRSGRNARIRVLRRPRPRLPRRRPQPHRPDNSQRRPLSSTSSWDTRLNRNVAVKILPASLAGETDRLRRFTLEAQSASSLNHPNILAIYDIGTHEGSLYIVSELLVTRAEGYPPHRS
jgi:hypothetical protein